MKINVIHPSRRSTRTNLSIETTPEKPLPLAFHQIKPDPPSISHAAQYNGAMIDRLFHLAIETSSRTASVTLGGPITALGTTTLPPQVRHTVDLLPAIDTLLNRYEIAKESLGELYVSIGPGSFTGLRVGIAAAKLLAEVLNVRLVAVPTIDVMAMNVGAPIDPVTTLAVGLNLKGESVYGRLYRWEQGVWVAGSTPELRNMTEWMSSISGPVWVLGDPLPGTKDGRAPWQTSNVEILDPSLAIPRSVHVRRLGMTMAAKHEFVSADELLPLYVRPPEAQVLWDKRLSTQETGAKTA
jgi:tRNA threonylcarbamoyladenosine biosynthesis protein TsaB